MRKDSYLYFVSTDGDPFDEGSKQLNELGKLPRLENLTTGEPRVIKANKKFHFVLPLRGESRNSMWVTMGFLVQLFEKLVNLFAENQVASVSMAKSSTIENLEFKEIITCLRRKLGSNNVKIIICLGLIQHPEPSKRADIINEAHSSAAGGHKGVTKTLNRIKYKYQWEHLKEDIQTFIQKCVPCQLKKLVRVKTKQKMIITDHPCIPLLRSA